MTSIPMILRLSGVAMIVLGAVIGAAVTPAAFIAIPFGIVDLVLAHLFASGRIGGGKVEDVAAKVETDPEFNPYARED